MGYNTRYTLEHDSTSHAVTVEAVHDYLCKEEGHRDLGEAIDLAGPARHRYDSPQPWKWYEHHKDMLALSCRFPSVLFTLSGAGEERGDLWRKYYRGGKCQGARAVITFAPFDPARLS